MYLTMGLEARAIAVVFDCHQTFYIRDLYFHPIMKRTVSVTWPMSLLRATIIVCLLVKN